MIYYAEDDQSIRELVVYTLKSTGFSACGVENGEALFAAIQKKSRSLFSSTLCSPAKTDFRFLKSFGKTPKPNPFP